MIRFAFLAIAISLASGCSGLSPQSADPVDTTQRTIPSYIECGKCELTR